MQEYFTEAVVLDREPLHELDFRLSVFTKRRGKIVAKAKSARKILSKLSGHLVPGAVAQIRFVERNGLQLVDALKIGTASASVTDLRALNAILADGEPDPLLWRQLEGGSFDWGTVLKILGWDPASAACSVCARPLPSVFHARAQEFFCAPCSSRSGEKEVIYIGTANHKSKAVKN